MIGSAEEEKRDDWPAADVIDGDSTRRFNTDSAQIRRRFNADSAHTAAAQACARRCAGWRA